MGRAKTIAGLIALCVYGCGLRRSDIVVGSKNFTEQVVLGEIVAQHLEHRLNRSVERRLNLGGTLLAHQALVHGDIDLYPEYTGTALTAILKEGSENNAAAVLENVRAAYRKLGIDWLDPLGIDNGFAMVVRGDDARRLKVSTLSAAAGVTAGWRLGAGYEFEQRPDGLAALKNVYHLNFSAAPRSMDLGLLYKALEGQQVDMIAANATDGLLSKMDLLVLDDDRHAFPPYQVCIAVRQEQLRKWPELRAPLAELSGKFTNAAMQALNYRVDGEHRPVAEVAREFLQGTGLSQ
jgi:glycine betaine/choline ABC-type transport system substrate-binding protein